MSILDETLNVLGVHVSIREAVRALGRKMQETKMEWVEVSLGYGGLRVRVELLRAESTEPRGSDTVSEPLTTEREE